MLVLDPFTVAPAPVPSLERALLHTMATGLNPEAPARQFASDTDEALSHACRADLERFATTFFPGRCQAPFSSMHRAFFTEYDADLGTRGVLYVTAAPRGHAKTSIRATIKLCHDIVYGLEDYILIVSSRHDMAVDKVVEVRDELESNEALCRVYGPQRGARWNRSDFVTTGGCRVRAVSPKSQTRGLLWHGTRPSKILLDDAENDEYVLTEHQREKFTAWYTQTIRRLGTRDTIFDVIGTILHRDSLLSQLLRNPGYRAQCYRAVLAFATNVPLWQAWRDIFIDLANPDRLTEARTFYEAHEDAMLAGAAVLWPEWESYYELMVMRLVDGETAFWQEKQNVPQRSERRIFDMDSAGYFRLLPEGLLRGDGVLVKWGDLQDLVAFWDPNTGAGTVRSDYSACPIVLRDRHGYNYVVDAYLEQLDPTSAQLEKIARLLLQWQVPKVGLEANNFQSLLKSDLEEALARVALEQGTTPLVQVVPVVNRGHKPARIARLEPLVANRWLWFCETLPQAAFTQMREFLPLPDAGKDDFCDSLESAIRLLRGEER